MVYIPRGIQMGKVKGFFLWFNINWIISAFHVFRFLLFAETFFLILQILLFFLKSTFYQSNLNYFIPIENGRFAPNINLLVFSFVFTAYLLSLLLTLLSKKDKPGLQVVVWVVIFTCFLSAFMLLLSNNTDISYLQVVTSINVKIGGTFLANFIFLSLIISVFAIRRYNLKKKHVLQGFLILLLGSFVSPLLLVSYNNLEITLILSLIVFVLTLIFCITFLAVGGIIERIFYDSEEVEDPTGIIKTGTSIVLSIFATFTLLGLINSIMGFYPQLGLEIGLFLMLVIPSLVNIVISTVLGLGVSAIMVFGLAIVGGFLGFFLSWVLKRIFSIEEEEGPINKRKVKKKTILKTKEANENKNRILDEFTLIMIALFSFGGFTVGLIFGGNAFLEVFSSLFLSTYSSLNNLYDLIPYKEWIMDTSKISIRYIIAGGDFMSVFGFTAVLLLIISPFIGFLQGYGEAGVKDIFNSSKIMLKKFSFRELYDGIFIPLIVLFDFFSRFLLGLITLGWQLDLNFSFLSWIQSWWLLFISHLEITLGRFFVHVLGAIILILSLKLTYDAIIERYVAALRTTTKTLHGQLENRRTFVISLTLFFLLAGFIVLIYPSNSEIAIGLLFIESIGFIIGYVTQTIIKK